MKNVLIIGGLAVILLAAGAAWYLTRPPAQPSESIQSAGQESRLPAPVSGEKLYRISQSGSQIQFKISEVLRGEPFTPVGATNQVSGDIKIAAASGAKPRVEIGAITINARTFKTDSPERDGAINHFILRTDDPANEFIVFTPTGVTGLPTNIEDGKPFTAAVTGNLMISGVTKPQTFTVTATLKDSVLTATANAMLKRSDYNLVIPNIPFVANVTDNFTVSGTFTANLVR